MAASGDGQFELALVPDPPAAAVQKADLTLSEPAAATPVAAVAPETAAEVAHETTVVIPLEDAAAALVPPPELAPGAPALTGLGLAALALSARKLRRQTSPV